MPYLPTGAAFDCLWEKGYDSMRSCIYCGRELEPDEQCSCAGAVARRNAKNASNGKSTAEENSAFESRSEYNKNHQNRTTYQTGYTKRDNRFKRAWDKHKAKSSARRNAYRSGVSVRGFWSGLRELFVRLIMSPVDTVSNPGYINIGTALTLSGLSGAVVNACLYFLRTGAIRSPFRLMLSLLTLHPMQSYSNLLYIFLSMVSGFLGGMLVFCIYSGIFWLINRFLFRQRTTFREFSPRLSLTFIPPAITSVIGILFGMISSTTLAILVVCGLIGMLVLTYEALRSEWISLSPGRVMYAMMLGCFVFVSVICYLIRISLI